MANSDPSPTRKSSFWISVFQRTGQRFLCSACAFAGDFNAFRLAPDEKGCTVRFLCPNCQQELRFDAASEAMVVGHGEMLHPEVSLAGRWRIARLRQGLLVGGVMVAVILVFVYALFGRLGSKMEGMNTHLKDLSILQAQAGLGGRVDLSFPGFQEIGAGYALLPKSATRESSGVRIRGVLVNEKAFTVDAKFRLTLGVHSQTFLVENVSPGTGETFEVFLPGAQDTAGTVLVEVLETSLRLE